MTIAILPAQLANQIAAGEVVERPASVVKELIENSLDAGATQIRIDIDKGGAKRIRISDNGSGIVKDELALALSRHATSKIKNLDDLEAIASLGFRGEALASISSVSRLTLTSKPAQQANAWQAMAQGRDMEVTIQPAAHPDGTTIEIIDLFFNTPARRKFLRTEKTEFAHIEEVIKRIALARFDVAFTLSHNGKVVRQYRQVKQRDDYHKRVAAVCGQSFIEHAIAIDCQHDALQLSGWVAKPSFSRAQNDLCYSYVNGRMMRDKLINHAIRQAFADSLPDDGYPAFVLFLSLDYREVDVNVHPAKHEVRFHQGRYVHDFICSVIQRALQQAIGNDALAPTTVQQSETERSYIAPLRAAAPENSGTSGVSYSPAARSTRQGVSDAAVSAYQRLLTPLTEPVTMPHQAEHAADAMRWLSFITPAFVLCELESLRLLSLAKLSRQLLLAQVQEKWSQGLTSQPLLLPLSISLDAAQLACLAKHQAALQQAGIELVLQQNTVQVRQFPALLRHRDVSSTIQHLLQQLQDTTEPDWCQLLAGLAQRHEFDENSARQLWLQAQQILKDRFKEQLLLNSVAVDLTSEISQLT